MWTLIFDRISLCIRDIFCVSVLWNAGMNETSYFYKLQIAVILLIQKLIYVCETITNLLIKKQNIKLIHSLETLQLMFHLKLLQLQYVIGFTWIVTKNNKPRKFYLIPSIQHTYIKIFWSYSPFNSFNPLEFHANSSYGPFNSIQFPTTDSNQQNTKTIPSVPYNRYQPTKQENNPFNSL